jgi:hypothetical protein
MMKKTFSCERKRSTRTKECLKGKIVGLIDGQGSIRPMTSCHDVTNIQSIHNRNVPTLFQSAIWSMSDDDEKATEVDLEDGHVTGYVNLSNLNSVFLHPSLKSDCKE